MIKKSILAGANNISTGGRTHDSSNYNSEGKKADGSDNLLLDQMVLAQEFIMVLDLQ